MATSLLWFYGFSVLFGMSVAVLLRTALRYMMLAEASESERAPAQVMRTITNEYWADDWRNADGLGCCTVC